MYWVVSTNSPSGSCRPSYAKRDFLPASVKKEAREAVERVRGLSVVEAAFLLGTLYTTLLPPRVRASLGAYYTPPALSERLLDLLSAEGADWVNASILDPSCGGGAFLTPVAGRILGDDRIRSLDAESRLRHVEARISGIEIDPFAAWMSQVFLDVLVYPESCEAGRKLGTVVSVGDALEIALRAPRRFDIIVGNPPYGRVKLPASRRVAFARSLYGHANLYGLFIDASLRMLRENGLLGFVTPTSFLGGQYFSRLRALLLREAPPVDIDFVEARSGVFDQVLQETCLAVFGSRRSNGVHVHSIDINGTSPCVAVKRVGVFHIKAPAGRPWVLPRSRKDSSLARHALGMKATLLDYGYKASTGPLVWNRHKHQLREKWEAGAFPIVWAEAIVEGGFSFDYKYRKRQKFFALESGQNHLLCTKPAVLVQRTTAKEQARRIVASALPESFLSRWTGVVVENHVNMVVPAGSPALSPPALAALLNTEAVDRVFRCLSGSVAVSATELHALPLPNPEDIEEIESIIQNARREGAGKEGLQEVEKIVAFAYGLR